MIWEDSLPTLVMSSSSVGKNTLKKITQSQIMEWTVNYTIKLVCSDKNPSEHPHALTVKASESTSNATF